MSSRREASDAGSLQLMDTSRTGRPAPQATPTASGGTARPTRFRRRYDHDWKQGLLFVVPALAFFLLFTVYPFVRTISLSFSDWDGLSASAHFVGLHNYVSALSDGLWWRSLLNGGLFVVAALLLMTPLGLLLAIGVERVQRGRAAYRTAFYVPTILSGIVVAIIWKWLYQPYGGPINQALDHLGLSGVSRAWLGSSGTALWAVSLASIWQGVGYPFLLYLAGLQSIPDEVYEAAALDGASGRRIFFSITLPLLRPVITTVNILTILGAMQMFNLVLAMTNGGPGYATEVPVLHIYREAFGLFHFGYASALAVIFGVLLLAVSIAQLRFARRGWDR